MIINKQTIRQLIIRTAEALGIQHLWLVDRSKELINYTQFHHPSNDANANAKLVNNNNNNNNE